MALTLPSPAYRPSPRSFNSSFREPLYSALVDEVSLHALAYSVLPNLASSLHSLPEQLDATDGGYGTCEVSPGSTYATLHDSGTSACLHSRPDKVSSRDSWRTESTVSLPLGPPSPPLCVQDKADIGTSSHRGLLRPTHSAVEDGSEVQAWIIEPGTDNPTESLPRLRIEGDEVRIDPGDDLPDENPGSKPAPLKRWISILRRRRAVKSIPKSQHIPEDQDVDGSGYCQSPQPGLRKSLSITSSIRFVTAVRSATVTLASASLAPRSRRSPRASFQLGGRGGSIYSDQGCTLDENTVSLTAIVDEKVTARSFHRRNVLREIISSEESYISDLKALENMYFTLLAGASHLTDREPIRRAVNQVMQLHMELLHDLHKVIICPDRAGPEREDTVRYTKHTRGQSADMIEVPARTNSIHAMGRRLRHSIDTSRPVPSKFDDPTCDTKAVIAVAKIYEKFLLRFFVYEAFVANNEIMRADAALTARVVPGWSQLERGAEALANTISPIDSKEADARKARTFDDLLIKPVQRICKYALFFRDLCKHTPVCDDPVAHELLDQIRTRLDEMANEVNRATDNAQTRRAIENTWMLQDRIRFDDQSLPRTIILRLLGRVMLCGVLHVAYETPDKVMGRYIVCILYRSFLVLTTLVKGVSQYTVAAVIPLRNASIESPENGRGLQCHTAPYTWKLVFELVHRQYEIIMSACSGKEEEEWRAHLKERITMETTDCHKERCPASEIPLSLQLELKPFGPGFCHPQHMSRRMSVHRASTLGPKANLRQVIIKNTHVQNRYSVSESEMPVMRSQSHLSSNNVPMLNPRRAERIRLETAISDVWSKDVLPYPGMAARRPDNPIRASANVVMRKLSMGSIASNFSRRSSSRASLSGYSSDGPSGASSQRSYRSIQSRRSSNSYKKHSQTLVDFHTAPDAFLPEDFELPSKPSSRRRRGLVMAVIGEQTMNFRQNTPLGFRRSRVATPVPLDAEHLAKQENRADPVIVSDDSVVGVSVRSQPRPETTVKPSIRSNDSSEKASKTDEVAKPNASLCPAASTKSAKRPTKSRSRLFRLFGLSEEK